MDLELRDRRALVTGGSSGIGAASALYLMSEGAEVVLAARGEDALRREASTLQERFGRPVGIVSMDVADARSIAEGANRAVDTLGGLDILVHAAGGSTLTDSYRARDVDGLPLRTDSEGWDLVHQLDDSTDMDWSHLYALNTLSLVRLVRSLRPILRESTQPRVVAVSSVSGLVRGRGQSDYHVAKAAEIVAAQCLAAELMDDGILVNVVCPGPTDTEASVGLREILSRETGMSVETVTERLWAGLPFRRAASAAEVGAVICFLTSAQAAYVNGAAVIVDGGASSRFM